MIQIQTFTFNPFEENTYLVYDDSGEGVVIDPGCYEKSEKDALVQFIRDKKIQLKYLLNTHCHIDHVLGNNFVKETYHVPFLIHKNDEPLLRSVKAYAPSYGFNLYQEALPDNFLSEGDTVSFGKTRLDVLFLPGHAPGHIGFYHQESFSLFSGDVLFEQSIGRTDLPGGDLNTLIKSIQQKIFALPDHVNIYPGHGAPTTVGQEKYSNPYCALSPGR